MELILTHENADFDAVAAQLAAHKLNPAARPVLPRRMNRNVRHFLALYWDELPFVRAEDLPREHVARALLVDTQSAITVKGMDTQTVVQIVDHHPLGHDLPRGWSYSGEEVGATTTLFVERLQAAGLHLTPVEATLLLLGIYEDTGSLSYLTTTARDMRCAAWLLEHGANLAVVNEFLHHPLSEEQRRLYDRLVESAETHQIAGQSVLIACAQANGFVEEVSTLAHKLRDLFEPAALFVLVQLDGHVQMVARSISDRIDVARITAQFGGGGHARAAAALIRDTPLAEVRQRLLALLPDFIQPAVTVGQIMSRNVQTLSPQTTVGEAAERMRRSGHEGYPIVQNGRVVGLLTRRAVDRAIQHKLEGATVDRFMERGEVAVRPEDPVERVAQVMMETGWGQVPVVDDGQVIGVVTRTDLLKLWTRPPSYPRREEIARRLEQALSPQVLALVREAGRIGAEMGYAVYFVGGLVRDLLLGQPIVDIDLVVEGDAIALARALAQRYGGRVRSHARFGTAKWFLHPQPAGAPEAIDFVTARTEFYESPSALPEVERSSIKLDLHRRDFTINTLAIALSPDRYGELLDFWGGERDLREGVIRVLHSLSFVDDPTRMLRAAQLEARLNFRMDPRTEELIGHALPMLDRVSGDRIRHELEAILSEAEPERALARLHALGVLRQIQPGLVWDDWLARKFAELRQAVRIGPWQPGPGELPPDLVFPYFGLLTYRLSPADLAAVLKRLKVRRQTAGDVYAIQALKSALDDLAEPQANSAIYRALKPFRERVLLVGWVATESEVARAQMDRYRRELRFIQPVLDGHALKAMGLEPGPQFSRILERLRAARLDGEVTSEEEERALVRALISPQRVLS